MVTDKKVHPKPKGKRPSYVRGKTNTLELSRVGSAIDLRVVREGSILGRLKVGQGSIWWIPRGFRRAKRMSWRVFAEMMKEWPFGGHVKAELKFKRGAVYCSSPGAGGPGKRISWEEFIQRMAMPLPKATPPKRRRKSTKTSP